VVNKAQVASKPAGPDWWVPSSPKQGIPGCCGGLLIHLPSTSYLNGYTIHQFDIRLMFAYDVSPYPKRV